VGEDVISSLSSTAAEIGTREDWEESDDATQVLVSMGLEEHEHNISTDSPPLDLDAPGGEAVDVDPVEVPRRGRANNFKDIEVSILLSEFQRNEKLLSGRCISTKKMVWVDIANKVSAASSIPRSVVQCRKKILNLQYLDLVQKKDPLGLDPTHPHHLHFGMPNFLSSFSFCCHWKMIDVLMYVFCSISLFR